MSIASKLVLSVALAGFALPALAQGSAATTGTTDPQGSKPAIHQTAPVAVEHKAAVATPMKSDAAKPTVATTGAAKPDAVKPTAKVEPAKTEPAKPELVKTAAHPSTTTTAPVTKTN